MRQTTTPRDGGDRGPGLVDLLTLGGYTLVCVVAGLGLGWWADSATGLTPVLTLLGLAVGVGVAVFGTWVRVRPLLDDGAEANGGQRRGRDRR
ncbi:MAG: AtpZ/AtpI family protein [Pseudonocardiales bacterium]|nr:AtpZ/AtpI family protein [Pseudonocardiales bacterium]